MSRLPKPGSDDDIWGELLNDYLNVEHNRDGSHSIHNLLDIPGENGHVLISSPSKSKGVEWVPMPDTSNNTASNGLTKNGADIRLGGALTTASSINLSGNTLAFANNAADKTEINPSGYIKVTRASGSNSFIEGWRNGEASPRLYADAYGTMYIGGSGTAAPPHKLAKDSGNGAWLNYSNTAGPASVFIIDSDGSGGSNAESTLTIRVKVQGGGSEFIDRFANHYDTNGDVGFGALVQKTGAGAYRDYLFGYYDAADTDPLNQIKDAERFYKILPQVPVGAEGYRRRGQIYFRPPNGTVVPSAHVHIGQGVGGSTLGSAPIKIDPGALLNTPEDGAIEYDGTHLYATIGSGRYQLDQQAAGSGLVHTTGDETINGTKTFGSAPIITPSAAPASPSNGQLWMDSGQLALASEQGGIKLFHPAAIFMATATVNNQNSTAETSIIGSGVGSATLPTNFLVPGKTIRINISGLITTSSTPPTSNFKVKLGATTICTTGTFTLPADMIGRMFSINAIITCRTAGATGAVLGEAQLQFMTAASGSPTFYEMPNTGTISVNTTAALLIDTTHTWGTGATSSYTISSKLATIEVLG